MKTSWVLTEDDKSKVAIRRPASSDNEYNLYSDTAAGSEPVRIKKETEVDSVFPGVGVPHIKQRRPSSPLSPPFKSPPSHFHPGEHHNHYSGQDLKSKTNCNPLTDV